MAKVVFATILFLLALVVLLCRKKKFAVEATQTTVEMPEGLLEGMNLKDQIMQRCSWRTYTNEELPQSVLDSVQQLVNRFNAAQRHIKFSLVQETDALFAPLKIKFIKGTKYALVIEVLKKERPLSDLLLGFYGELAVLRLTELNLQTVWLGGQGMTFDASVAQRLAGTSQPVPVVIPFGHATQPAVIKRRRVDVSINWPSDKRADLELILRAPSAINLQPYRIQRLAGGIEIAPKDTRVTAGFMTHWLDVGIAAAHAILVTGATSFNSNGASVLVPFE